ncbi:phosphoserine phosphatase SerB [Herbiconiux sp. CPCC 203407]|uniref:phosphoserine phosphatase n=1 Tax=Herbiconiux oxytropis TaxID=2970915 RepID=A0AA41XIN3_9MICO|nr:phosphoserine phosphatase SerB [Herbiconiux oxytropis]MCS5721897.1 phosphoserine phosphatase SerB [Herbiconiux oxytropis]MCS5727423.1 phosphoserine phosphatase SerB [Herbiconiux oxytropis]
MSILIVLDVDSTLIENEVIEMLGDLAGCHAEVAEITERAMRGELDFAQSLAARVRLLEGLPSSCFDEVRAAIRVTDGVPEMIAAVHAAGGAVAVVSGGFHEVLDPLAESLGLDHWRANRLGVADGRLTGTVSGPIIDPQSKADALTEWAGARGTPLSRTVAVGDGANDLKMMEIAGLSVAFHARPLVRENADLVMDVRDLSQLLPLVGLRG